MEKIEFTEAVKFGDDLIDAINVAPMTFVEMTGLWSAASGSASKPEVALQRARIIHQTHFMSNGKRIIPDENAIGKLPIPVAKAILPALDASQGKAGKLVNDGDGVTTSLLYQLGTPIGMKTGKGEDATIIELEFQATTFGEIEDILAAENDVAKTLELLRRVAKPVGSKLTSLPGWALDRITVADGVTIMMKVLPRF